MPGADEFDSKVEELRRQFWGGEAGAKTDTRKPKGNGVDISGWGEPDMGVLRLRRRPPPPLLLEVFGETWGQWLLDAAAAAACPVDYVAGPLLASVSTLIGNARWAQAWPGWDEPPHLWAVVVGDSGTGKSPGGDCMMRGVLPEIERRMGGDYPDRLRDWQAAVEFDKIAMKRWKDEFREAQEKKKPLPPIPKSMAPDIAPEKPRLRQHDITIEQAGAVLATAAPKGVMMVRDEIAGWLSGMDAYNPAGRAFWLEAYGGRPYRVERRKHGTEPIEIERLVVAVYGGKNSSSRQWWPHHFGRRLRAMSRIKSQLRYGQWPESKERERHDVGLTVAACRLAETVLEDLGKLGIAVTLDEKSKARFRTPRGISLALVGPVIERHGDLIEAYLRDKGSNQC